MSSKQLGYLFMVLVVCCSVAGGIAHGQSTGTVTFKGTVLIDDSPAPGITITGTNSAGIAGLISSAESREDGSYTYGWLSFSGTVSAGDTFTFTLTDSEGNSHDTAPYTLTAADVAVPFTVDLDLVPVSAGITVQSALSAIPADGTSTSTITAMVRDDSGNPAAGDTVTISADKGTVGATTDNGDGTYSATYTAPSLALAANDTAQISAASAQLGETAMTSITLTPVPTTVTVSVVPSIFSADTPGTGAITISVDRAGPVADETVTISAPSVGTVSAVTNNGDGTYSATYTSGGIAGRVTLTATATQANESAGAIIIINAGAPAAVTVSALPTGVSSSGSSIITAMVSDSTGNGVGGQSLTAETSSGGTITAFTESTTRFGSYSATYTAPMVDAAGTETITVTVGTISGETTLQLTPVPPVEVSILNVEGTVFMADGETPAVGVEVEVSVGSNTGTGTTDADGYFVTFLDFLAPVARGGDPVSIVVTDANDGTHGPYTSVLSNDELGEGGTATVSRDVTTAIPVPPRTVNVLVVNGIVYTIDGETPAAGVSVVVTVGSTALPMTTTDANGFFERTHVGLDTPAASTDDLVSIVVTDATGTTHQEDFNLTSAQLGTTGSATVTKDVLTAIPVPPRSVNILVVNGVVYTIDGETPAEGANVTVTVGSTALPMTTTDANGFFERTAVGLDAPAAVTDDVVSIVVTDDTGAGGSAELTLTNADLGTTGSATITQDVMTDIVLPPMSVDILVVEGVVYRDDMTTPVDSGFGVTVTIGADESQTTSTDADGVFSVTFLEIPPMTVATTGDMVSITVTDSTGTQRPPGDQFTLTHIKLADPTITRKVYTDIGATSKLVNVVGTVYLRDGAGDPVAAASHLRENELTVIVTNTDRNNLEQRVPVDDNGEYAATLISFLDIAAETGDSLTVEVEEAGVIVGMRPHTLTTPEVQASQAMVNVYTSVPAKVGVLNVVGSVVELDGITAAGAGLQVTITLVMDGQTMTPMQVTTDASGGYEYTFFDPPAVAASTGDVLMVDVLRSNGYHGHAEINPLRSIEIIYRNQPLVVDPIKMLPPIKSLGGLSINPQYVPEELKRISRDAIKTNPVLLEMIPSGILYLDLMKGQLASLPAGFDPTNDAISKENFGNAIAPRPVWHVLGQDMPTDPNRWLNGDLLNLYVLTGPTAAEVMFTLSGGQSGRASAMRIAAGDTVPYTFQLEEERAVLFLPSESMSVFASVDLVIDGAPAGIPMTRNMDTGIWEAEAQLTPGSTVYYHYRVRLAHAYEVDGRTVENWVVPDPRNLQVQDRGIVETLLAPELGPDLVEIVTTTNLQLRSVLNVPAANALQSLWFYPLDLTGAPDGMYQLDTVITHADTVITTDSDYQAFVETIGTQAFMVDRSAPTADLMLTIAESSGLYQNPDGSYVAAAHADGGTLTITATPTGDPMDPGAYLYQMITLDAAGNPGVNVWKPATLTTDLALTYMEPHQVTLPISGENKLGNFGLRAVGINDILNISSSTPATMLEVVPLTYDNAAITAVHADYNGDGTTDGRFESVQHASDGVTIFSDRSTVTLTLEITERTDHPLTSIMVDFQIDGAGDWKPIHVFDAAALTDVAMGSELTVSWDRTEDFAGLLDMRGQATLRVTVSNALDAVSDDSMATFEVVPPALQLGGLSINTSYEAGLNGLQALGALDVTALATSLLGTDPSALISPSPLPVALALLGNVLGHIQTALPAGFETADEHIHRENFGNALTPKPIWYFMASADQQDSGRWLNGNQLSLYTVAGPTAQGLTFSITGAQTATATASKVEAGGSFMYNFQLEEELVAIFAGSMPAFAAVTLMIDGQAPIAMEGHAGVWSAEAALTPGSTVSYYYRVELAQPYHDPLNQITITAFPIPDPRNLQMAALPNLLATIEALLDSELNSLATMDPGSRSVFRVPAVDDDSQSLWVGKLDLPADGMYQLDVAVQYSGGSTDELTGKMFTVDTTAPTADTMVHLDTPGENIGMYHRGEDGVYVATALPNPGKASLNVSATPIDGSDLEAYLYQVARLDDAGNPGTWNPVLTMDLQGLDAIVRLLTNPASVLPLTSRPPHHVQMLVRSGTGNDLDHGTYGLRAVGIDNILNADSSRAAGVVLELVAPDPDSAMISLVQADYDGNGTTDGPYESQPTAGDVTIFSDVVATLTVDITERSDHPLTIELEYQIAGGGWHSIGTLSQADLANAMEGDQLTVNWHVGDYAELPALAGQVMVRTTATNALTISRESVATFNYQRRLPPEIAAVHTEPMNHHPDTGAPQGTITVSAFTHAMTNPITTTVQFVARRAADTEWQPIGVAQLLDTTVVSNVQVPLIEDLVGAVVAGAPTASIAPFYRQWTITVDTTTLEDTIGDKDPNGPLDTNPWVVRAVAADAAGTAYPSADGVEDRFSLDNYSPTAFASVANEVEIVNRREDGSYYVSGLLLEGVPDPMLTLTARTGSYPGAFPGGIKLAITDNASGATLGVDVAFEDAGNYLYTGVLNLASVPNGTYTLAAVAHAADGTPEERIIPIEITVEVGNFTPPENFADPSVDILSIIDTEGDVRSPSEIDAIYPTGFPAIEDKITFTLTVPNVSASDLDVLIGDDENSARMLGALTDDGIMVTANADGSMTFEIMLDTSVLDEGQFNLVGVVIKPNGIARFGLPGIRVDRSAPVIAIVSPISRSQLTSLPTIQISYTDASGFDPNDMEMEAQPVVITLTRLANAEMLVVNDDLIDITAVATGEVLTQSGNLVYTHYEDLVGGAYRIDATVTDVLGNVATAESVEFTVEGVKPTVSITSPLIGQVIDPRQPLIVSAALTGNGEITVTEFQINGTDIEGALEDNWLTYTMQPPLVGGDDSILQRGSDNTISVKIVDSEEQTAEGTASFAVSLDSTPPVISGPAPKGEITRKLGRVTARVSDNESNITRIQFAIDDNPLQDISFSPGMVVEVGRGTEVQGRTNFNFFDAPLGTHSVTIVAESTGGTSTLTWEFTIVSPDSKPPEVVTYSPLGIIRTDRPVLAATVSDESGFARNGITLILAGVPGNQGSGRRSSPTSTTVTFTPSISVTPGPYTARLTVIDRYNNRTEAEWQFTVELDETPPSITATSPHGVVHADRPLITASASDDMSGVADIEITAKDDGGLPVNGITVVRSDKTAATFTPSQELRDGTYTVDVKATDMSGNVAAARWQFTVDLDLIPPSVILTRPTQEHTENRRPVISAAYTDNMSGVDPDSITLTLNGSTITPDEMSETQVVFTPEYDLPFGSHTVTLELSDLAPKPNTTVHEWTFHVERIGIADARNYPNPFKDETTIAFRVSRQAKITIRVYDFTGRLVATPVSDSIREAGLVEVEWHAETSAGDHLARGVYFCHILMESELEPQSTILKMAVIAD